MRRANGTGELDLRCAGPAREKLAPGAFVLRGFALPYEKALQAAIAAIAKAAPFRRMETPGGYRMSVAMTCSGALGWVSDRNGYRYTPVDPETNAPWPPLPASVVDLAATAAAAAGFEHFEPDACLVNRYEPGTKLSMHQDRNEQDFDAPIVSVSLGVPAIFCFGGLKRNDKALRVPLGHGDVVVWGGPARLRYHGVLRLKESHHPFAGSARVNLTLRKAGGSGPS